MRQAAAQAGCWMTPHHHSPLHLAGRTLAALCAGDVTSDGLKHGLLYASSWAVSSGYRPAAATNSTRGSRHPHPMLCKYFEILDLAIQCLTRRISNKAVAVLSRIEEVIQEAWSGNTFNEQSVEEICQHYRGEFDQRRLQAQLLCLPFPNLRPTTSVPEANVEFHNIVAAVAESQLNAMIRPT